MRLGDNRSDLPDDECKRAYNALLTNVRQHRKEQLKQQLSILPTADAQRILKHCENEGETLLHTAVKLHCNPGIVTCLVDACPDLLTASRNNSGLYRGQTALHMAITDRNLALTTCLLEKAKAAGGDVIAELIQKCATGRRFVNTVMLGEHALAVAALTFNIEIMCKLREFGAKLEQCNSQGDNVIHCLIKYAHLYPDKTENVLHVCNHIVKVTNSSVHCVGNPADITSIQVDRKFDFQIWLTKNYDLFNSLQLSALLGLHDIFKFIMEMRGVYCYVNSEDGLFDVELYDVTDIDIVYPNRRKMQKIEDYDESMENKPGISEPYRALQAFVEDISDIDNVSKVPTLELMFNSEPSTVFKFIQMTPLRYVINKKWRFYRWFYGVWGLLHVLYMVGFTVYAVRRSDFYIENNQGAQPTLIKKNKVGKSVFETFFLCMNIFVACIYLFQEIIRIMRGHMPWSISHLVNCHHNGPFRLALVIFSLTVLADSVWAIAYRDYNDSRDIILVIAMILGWWFLVFFLRGFRQFSFFTVMIQKIIVGDMFRFAVIITMELIAFTTGLYIAFRGAITTEESVLHYDELMVFMFKMMLGLTSLDVLFEARDPWFAVCLYVAFVILTFVLMVNSLIAMMSNTCSVVSQNREIQYRVQQLSIVLFFESIIPESWKMLAGSPRACTWYDPNTNRFTLRKRYLMEVKSLHEITKSRSRLRPNPETMLETIFNTVTQIQLPKLFSDVDSPVELLRSTLGDNAPKPGNTDNDYDTHTNELTRSNNPVERTVPERAVNEVIENPHVVTRTEFPRMFERRVFPEEYTREDFESSPVRDRDISETDDGEIRHKKKKKKKKSKKHHVHSDTNDTTEA